LFLNLIWVFLFLLLVKLAKVLPDIIYFFKDTIFYFINFCTFILLSNSLIFVLTFYNLFPYNAFLLTCSCFSNNLKYILRLFI
jgi:hypothetical protein